MPSGDRAEKATGKETVKAVEKTIVATATATTRTAVVTAAKIVAVIKIAAAVIVVATTPEKGETATKAVAVTAAVKVTAEARTAKAVAEVTKAARVTTGIRLQASGLGRQSHRPSAEVLMLHRYQSGHGESRLPRTRAVAVEAATGRGSSLARILGRAAGGDRINARACIGSDASMMSVAKVLQILANGALPNGMSNATEIEYRQLWRRSKLAASKTPQALYGCASSQKKKNQCA